MRITVSMPSTGVFYSPGLARPVVIDVDQLPKETADKLKALADRAGIFDQSNHLNSHLQRACGMRKNSPSPSKTGTGAARSGGPGLRTPSGTNGFESSSISFANLPVRRVNRPHPSPTSLSLPNIMFERNGGAVTRSGWLQCPGPLDCPTQVLDWRHEHISHDAPPACPDEDDFDHQKSPSTIPNQ